MVGFFHLPAETSRDDWRVADLVGVTLLMARLASKTRSLTFELWVFVKMQGCTVHCRHKPVAPVIELAIGAMSFHSYQTG